LTTKGKIPGHEIQTELAHGPHGCPNEQAFLELLKENKENHEQ
jgi:hypothetical protein